MSFSDTFETSVLALIFNATAIANFADNTVTSPATSLYWSLHTASPGDGGNQSTSAATYTGYTRIGVARTSGGHSVAAGVCSPVANIDFPAGTGGSGTITNFGVGRDLSGTGLLICHGTVTPNLSTGTDITPRLTTATTITLE